MSEKKKKFEYLTGNEIFATREAKLNTVNSKRYDNFCEQMNAFWEQEKIEDQLYSSSGVAIITSKIYNTAEYFSFSKKHQSYDSRISSSKLINYIKDGTSLAENVIYIAENKNDKFWMDMILRTTFLFGMELDLFDRFITENGFYWNIGIKVTQVGRSSFFDSTPCIYAFQYVLYIACNDDDKAITNIKLGLEGIETDKIQKDSKKMSFWKSLNWNIDSTTGFLFFFLLLSHFSYIW